MKSLTGAVLLITHQRVDQLRKVITNLELSWIKDYKYIYAVLHKGNEDVKEVLNTVQVSKPQIITVDRAAAETVTEAINRNVYEGLSQAFANEKIDYVTILEDDIQVRRSFLDFNCQVMKTHFEIPRFKGINGFSGARYEQSKEGSYGYFRYGFGWGWTVPRSTWNEIQEIWNSNPKDHWDAVIEDNIRTGFVVMPHNSRILNIGFDGTATHTTSGGYLESRLQLSFNPESQKSDIDSAPTKFELNWRKDATIFKNLRIPSGFIIQLISEINLLLSTLTRKVGFLTYPSRKIRALLFRIIFQLSR